MVGVASGLGTLMFAVYQYKVKVANDKRDLRWRRSEAAMKLLDTLFADPAASDALKMIEFGFHDFQPAGASAPIQVTRYQTIVALGGPSMQVTLPGGPGDDAVNEAVGQVDGTSEMICDSFGRLFFLLSRIHDAVVLDYVELTDVESILTARLKPLLTDAVFLDASRRFVDKEHAYARPALDWLGTRC